MFELGLSSDDQKEHRQQGCVWTTCRNGPLDCPPPGYDGIGRQRHNPKLLLLLLTMMMFVLLLVHRTISTLHDIVPSRMWRLETVCLHQLRTRVVCFRINPFRTGTA